MNIKNKIMAVSIASMLALSPWRLHMRQPSASQTMPQQPQ